MNSSFSGMVSSFGPFCLSISCSFAVHKSAKASHRSRNKRASSTVFQIHLPICGKGSTLPPMYTQFHPRSPNDRQRVATRSIDPRVIARSPLYVHPHPPFFRFLLQTQHFSQFDPWASLAWRLGGPWATLGPPKGHPTQTQSPAESHRQRVATPKCENPASSRVQITRVAQPPSAVRFNYLHYLHYHFSFCSVNISAGCFALQREASVEERPSGPRKTLSLTCLPERLRGSERDSRRSRRTPRMRPLPCSVKAFS